MAKTAGTWRCINAFGPSSFTAIDTTQAFDFGTIVEAKDMGDTQYGRAKFMYVKGVANTIAGDACVLAGDFSIVRLTARSKGMVVVCLSALDAATKFGWVQISGQGVVNAGDVAAGAQLYATGAGGVGTVDDAVVAGDILLGMSTVTDDNATTLGQTVFSMPNGAVAGDVDNS